MVSHYAATSGTQLNATIAGLVYFSFPLHPSGKPATKRAEHLIKSSLPQLFLSGDRDGLADLSLMKETLSSIPNATLQILETADHSFKPLKRTRKRTDSVYEEAASHLKGWLASVL